MKLLEARGACLLVMSLAVDGRKHVEVPSFPAEPLPSSPFVLLSTLSGTSAYLSLPAYNSPSHIPL